MTKSFIQHKQKTLALIASVFFIFSCSKYEKVNVSNTYSRLDVCATEAAFSVINSVLMETESNFLNATCSTSSSSPCAPTSSPKSSTTYNWNSCTFDNSKISFSGLWRRDYTNDPGVSCTLPIPNGEKVTRRNDSGNAIYSMPNGDTLEMFTLQYPSFPGQVLGQRGVETLQVDATNRSILIDTVQVTRKNAGNILYDAYLYASDDTLPAPQLFAVGKLSTADRVLTGFTYVYFKEKARVKVIFQSTKWENAACCYPTTGNMNLEFDNFNPSAPASWPTSGKTATVSFTNTCGEAEITGTDGVTSDYTFTECF